MKEATNVDYTTPPGGVRIRYKEIPDAVMRPLYHDILEAVKRFKQDPENQKKFEAWKKARAEKEDTAC